MKRDKRIPKVVRDFTDETTVASALTFLQFEDWIARKENQAKDWVVVARSFRQNAGRTDLFTSTVLCWAGKAARKKLLSVPDWEVSFEFGQPSFYATHDSSGKVAVHYDSGLESHVHGVKFRPFVIHRSFHGYKPSTVELIQNFLLYHEAFFEADKGEYHRIDENGDIRLVARVIMQDNNYTILVDAHHLKDYLAANKCCLVRYHDHRRKTTQDVSAKIGRFFQTSFASRDARFLIAIHTDRPLDDWKSSSRLLGKDIVVPYPEPDKRHTSWATEDKRKFVSFIIDIDENGEPVESTCDEDQLSNYFTDRGTPHFLTPVFFRRDVIAKYYQEPKRYSVTAGSVGCLDLWTLQIDTTEERLIQVWLGDLSRIPYKEQLHWREYNVTPKGTITRERFMRDFQAEFARSTDPIYDFHVAFEALQNAAKERLGGVLFLVLDEKDRYAYETIHLPVTDEWKEFDDQVLALAKITVDSLNIDLLSRISGKKINGDTIKGSLDLLEICLTVMKVEEKFRRTILHPLHAIQTIRSAGVAHRKGSEFNDVLRRHEIDNMSNYARVKKLVVDVTRALIAIADIVRRTYFKLGEENRQGEKEGF